ncbi:hypothetical protein BH10BDE1_BH10BDE1_24520 [soil metagenome]
MRSLPISLFFLTLTSLVAPNVALATAPTPDAAVKLSGKWIDQTNHAFTVDRFMGHLTLVTLAYTTCRTLCPMVGARVKSIDEALLKKGIQAEIILVSIDPEKETAQTLHAWMKSRGLLRDRWHFIKGSREATHELAGFVRTGFSDHAGPDHIEHTSTLAILGKDGKIRSTVDLMGGSVDAVTQQVIDQID